MNYQALYRRYRPSTFDEVVGQESIVKTLKNAIKNQAISHAYLFTGPRGTGKTSVAKIIAKAVNCEKNGDGNPCGKCTFCKLYANKEVSDIVEIDAASNNGVDEIRQLRDKVNFVAGSCKYKVYIIDEVHMLSTGAFNALLKTLEEPPPYVIFILATTEPYKVPLTIISRCQRFDFGKIGSDKIRDYLKDVAKKEKVDLSSAAAIEIARLADGGLRDGIGIMDKLISYKGEKVNEDDVYEITGTVSRSKIGELVGLLFTKDYVKLLDVVEKTYSAGVDLVIFVEDIILFLRDLYIYNLIPSKYDKEKDNAKEFDNILKLTDEKQMPLIIDRLNCLINNMKASGNPKLLFEITFLDLMNRNSENVNRSEPKARPMVDVKGGKEAITKEKVIDNKGADEDKLSELVRIRTNNTLAVASKKDLANIRKSWIDIKGFSVDEQFGPLAGILLDAEVKAAGGGYILLTYNYASIAERVNKSLIAIEELLNKVYNKKYRIVAITEEEWKKVKKEYIDRKGKGEVYSLIEEPNLKKLVDIDESIDKVIQEAISTFGEELVIVNK